MAGTSVISGSVSNFGSLASIRKQAYAIGDRVKAESAARRAEQEKTGLIRNLKLVRWWNFPQSHKIHAIDGSSESNPARSAHKRRCWPL